MAPESQVIEGPGSSPDLATMTLVDHLSELLPDHTAMIAVLTGHVTIDGGTGAGAAEIVRFERDGSQVRLRADAESMLLVMTGEPLDEPVVGYGPFVMNSPDEIRQAVEDFNSGRFVRAG